MGNEMLHSVNKKSYDSLDQGDVILTQIFQGLFFDFVDQKVDGLLVLDSKLDFIAGNEKGREFCKELFPFSEAINTSYILTAELVKKKYQLGYYQFNVGIGDGDGVFDFSIFPKALGQDKTLSCYLCTVGKRGTAPQLMIRNSQCYELLTKREVEVVELMSAGMGNREIAGRLFISERTVHKHLENIREKLGVNNRIGILNKLNLMYS